MESQIGVIVLGSLSALLSLIAIYRLYKTVSAVEYAALRPSRTIDFEVGFDRVGKMTKQVRVNKKTELRVFAVTHEDNIEDSILFVRLPSEIETTAESAYEGLTITRHPDHSVVRFYDAFVPKSAAFGVSGKIIPKKIGEYNVDVWICAKGMYMVKRKLTIKVVR